jgi:hypothetical protein
MDMDINRAGGWLFENPEANQVHEISNLEMGSLFELAAQDDQWAANVKEELLDHQQRPFDPMEFLLQKIRAENVAGTVVRFPYGLSTITFPSRRHLFRGENQVFERSLPTLNRQLREKSPQEKVMWKALADLRIYQFWKFIWQINVVPYWEAKLCDVNVLALAQHYGFATHLLDLTNDFNVALFFATCQYDANKDCYRPLTEAEVRAHPDGVIFHTPDWQLDYLNGGLSQIEFFMRYQAGPKEKYSLDNGDLDGFAFQIGYQPLHRCHHQSGYILPMAVDAPLQENWRFEKLHFKQSVEFSQWVFDRMDGGKKVMPYEGISEAKEVMDRIKASFTFSEDDVGYVYDGEDVDKTAFPTLEAFTAALRAFDFDGRRVEIQKEEVSYPVTQDLLERINAQYDGKDLLEPIGGVPRRTPQEKRYREQRCIQIYGKLI